MSSHALEAMRSVEPHLQAVSEAHRLEVALLSNRILRLEALLIEHGIPLPELDAKLGEDGRQHLEACKAVVRGAYELLPHLERLRELVGSGVELLDEPWRKP